MRAIVLASSVRGVLNAGRDIAELLLDMTEDDIIKDDIEDIMDELLDATEDELEED